MLLRRVLFLGPKTEGLTKTHIPISGDWLKYAGIVGLPVDAIMSYNAARNAQNCVSGGANNLMHDKKYHTNLAVICGVMSVLSAAITHEQIEDLVGYNLGVNTSYDIVSWGVFGMSCLSEVTSGISAALCVYQQCNKEAVITMVEENIQDRSEIVTLDGGISTLQPEAFIVADPYVARENVEVPALAEVAMVDFSGTVLDREIENESSIL